MIDGEIRRIEAHIQRHHRILLHTDIGHQQADSDALRPAQQKALDLKPCRNRWSHNPCYQGVPLKLALAVGRASPRT